MNWKPEKIWQFRLYLGNHYQWAAVESKVNNLYFILFCNSGNCTLDLTYGMQVFSTAPSLAWPIKTDLSKLIFERGYRRDTIRYQVFSSCQMQEWHTWSKIDENKKTEGSQSMLFCAVWNGDRRGSCRALLERIVPPRADKGRENHKQQLWEASTKARAHHSATQTMFQPECYACWGYSLRSLQIK